MNGPPVRRKPSSRDDGPSFLADRPVQRLVPVEVIRQGVGIAVEVAGGGVVVPGGGHERVERSRGTPASVGSSAL